MWKEALFLAVVIPAGLLTAGIIYIRKYRKTPQGKIQSYKNRISEAESLKARYDQLINTPALGMTRKDFDELEAISKELDRYDKMLERKNDKI